MYAIVANVESDRVLLTGSKVWICFCHKDNRCPSVLGISKDGNGLRKYSNFKRLRGYRVEEVPPTLWGKIAWKWPSKEDAEAVARILTEAWDGVRVFSRDGTTLLKDGVTTREALERMEHEINGK